MGKYRSFYNFNPCNLFLKQDKSCLLKDIINRFGLRSSSLSAFDGIHV